MTDHGRVNLRANTATSCGDDRTRQLQEQEVERIRDTMTVRFQVAPGQQFTTASGLVLKPGDEVMVSQLHGFPVPAWSLLESLVHRGLVLEANSQVLTGADVKAKHRVAPGTSTITRAGILGPGRAISAADLEGGEAALADLIARGAVVAK